MVQPTTDHPSREELLAYSQGRLAPSSAHALEDHLADCRWCCAVLETAPADTFLSRLRQADGATPNPFDQPIPPELIDHPRYEVLGLVGEGGMGTVYRAVHRRMERIVALKVMRPSLMRRPAAVQRFQQEVRAAARLHHPHIVTAYDADQAGELHFLVMEYVEGQNLADHLRANGALSVAEACRYARQAALGLQHAHEQGMVHRDIKPQNLMLQTDGGPSGGIVKVLDFGLARLSCAVEGPPGLGLSSGPLTGTGTVMGTADYIAPEQAADPRAADIRADIYALGCTLFHLLSGRPPFPGGTPADKLARHGETPLPSLRAVCPEAPPQLAVVLRRMTAKNPARRYTTPAEVAEALAPFGRAPAVRLPQVPKRRRWLVVALVFLTVGLFAGGVAWHLVNDRPAGNLPGDNAPEAPGAAAGPGKNEIPSRDVELPREAVIPNQQPGGVVDPQPVVGNPGDNDPAEEAAIQVVKKHGGFVTQDSTQPNNPVVGVGVFRNTFTDTDLKALASLTRVRKMNLAGTAITGTGFKYLASLKALTELDVAQTSVNDAGLKAIAALTQLKILVLRGTRVSDTGLRQLAPLKRLEELHVNGSRLGDTAAVHIATNVKQLKRLYFDNSQVGDAGVIELARQLKSLQVLTINGTRVTNRGLEALTNLPALQELHLSFFEVTDDSAVILARCKNLRVLNLFATQITDKGLRALGSLPQLRDLDLHRSRKVSNKAILEFIKAHPECSVKQ